MGADPPGPPILIPDQTTPMTRLILPLTMTAITLWVGGAALSAGLQITKAHADRLAVTMCEVSQTECR